MNSGLSFEAKNPKALEEFVSAPHKPVMFKLMGQHKKKCSNSVT